MKKNYSRIRFAAPFLALALASAAHAGVTESTAPAPAAAEEDVVSGVLKLDFNSHFISYGNDVWADGRNMGDPTFNPSVEVTWELPAGFTFSLGTWWDVNSKGGGNSSPLGGRIQEVDVWAGVGYTIGDFTTKVTYQNWMYNGDTEDILDITFSYDCFLSPSLTIHNRLDAGGAGPDGDIPGTGDEGTILVAGISYGFDAGPVSISFPLNVAYFLDDGFHSVDPATGDEADSGFGYGSIGVAASLPLSFIDDAYGEWTLNANLTYYVTSTDVIPANPRGDFLTAGLGVAVAF